MSNEFGGIWTQIKLQVLEDYLKAYSNVFKNQDWCHLIYVDAFAGSGDCNTRDGLIEGSAKIALNIPRFDEFIFIELDPNNISNLNKLKEEYPNKEITIIQGNCNEEIIHVLDSYNWKNTRAISFLDPYSMELTFHTLKLLADTKAIDVWYLFPIGDSSRALKRDGKIFEYNEKRLNQLFGDNDWKSKLYYTNPQISMFEKESLLRKEQKEICCCFRKRMETIFASVSCPICLKNSNNAPLFLLYFAVANERAMNVANKIANHIIFKEQTFVCNNPKK